MSGDQARPCKWLRVHRVFDPGTREFRGNVYQCGFKVDSFNRGRMDVLFKFIELLESKGLQGVVGAQQDCPVAPTDEWTACPVYEPVK